MKLSQRLFKSFKLLAIGACFLGFTSQVNLVNASTPAVCKDKLTQTTSKENIFSENNAAVATKLDSFDDYCLGTPDRFELVIYEMGLCTSNPITGSPKAFSKENCIVTMAAATGATADLAGSTVALPPAVSRPINNTYTHAFMTILNEFGLKGSISLNGTVYYSTNTGGVTTTAPAVNHTEELDSFDETFDADFGPENMPTGGKVSALLTDSALTRAANAAAVTRLVAVFETNSGSPVVINDSVNGVEVELLVDDGGYGIAFNGSGVPIDFGSAPFKPVFSTF